MKGIPLLRFSLFAVLLVLLCTSCEKVLMRSDVKATSQHVFEHLWTDIHNRYAYFEFKGVDWLAIREKYQGKIHEEITNDALFDVLAEMLSELEDGHVNLSNPANRSRNWSWFQDFPLNYNQGIVDRRYLGRDFHISGPFRHQILDSVLYINYRSFADAISHQNLDAIIKRAQGLKGVIIDVRSNGGGNQANAERLAARFTDMNYTYGKVRIKTGPCPDCFSSWTNLTVTASQFMRYNGPVIVLTNRASYSTTTYFAAMMRQNSKAMLIGDQTGGGGGTPAFGELPNGWLYRFSSTQTIDVDGNHFEPGIPVNEIVEMEKSEEDSGIDSIIERALQLLQ
jgi:C-terminal processing protease CtpA/Prc